MPKINRNDTTIQNVDNGQTQEMKQKSGEPVAQVNGLSLKDSSSISP
jgi:hypothetical protein